MLFNKYTQHLTSCERIPGISINEPIGNEKPVCCEEVNYRRCGSQLCYLGCLRMDPDDGTCYGYCSAHWKKYCEDHGVWSSHLSYCANTKCDQMKLSYEDRSKINRKNIKDKLDLPGDKRHNHVTDYISQKEESETESSSESSSESLVEDCFIDDDTETVSYENSNEEISEESHNENIAKKEILDLTENSDIKMIDLTEDSNRRGVKRKASKKADKNIIRIAKFRRIYPDMDFSSRSIDSESETDDGFIDYS